MPSTEYIWLITGASTGLGKELALKALSQGDRVIVTSRHVGRLELLEAQGATTVQLDHNEPLDNIKASIAQAVSVYGKIDIVVNNAAYVQTGMLEETSPEETLTQFQANVLGPLNLYRAVLPYLRQQRSGILATIGSMAAWYPMAGCNLYNASKASMRCIALGLESETKEFGIKHCLIEPGFFRTDLLDPAANMQKTTKGRTIKDYAKLNKENDEAFAAIHGRQLGNPETGAAIMYDVLTSSGEAEGRELPSEFALGSDAVIEIYKSAQNVLDGLDDWEEISVLSDFPDGQ